MTTAILLTAVVALSGLGIAIHTRMQHRALCRAVVLQQGQIGQILAVVERVVSDE